jgi:hypothetical protein
MNEQSETIIWHKYPEVKPPKDRFYLIDEQNHGVDIMVYDDEWRETNWGDVRAWAELPKGWVEK